MSYPRTREEAESQLYNVWAGNPKGFPYNARKCAFNVLQKDWPVFHQCCRNSGHGPDGLYCKQHARMVEGNA
jgi:uncharacterized protein YhdP